LTRRQIEILAGRPISKLSAEEKIDFANSAARPLSAHNEVSDRDKFRIAVHLLEGVDPLLKLNVANGADRMGRIRQRVREIGARMLASVDPIERHSLEMEREQYQREGAELYALIGPYEVRG
jgi:hypothetical protein